MDETECHLALQKWTDWKVFLAPDAQLMCMDGSKSCTYKGESFSIFIGSLLFMYSTISQTK